MAKETIYTPTPPSQLRSLEEVAQWQWEEIKKLQSVITELNERIATLEG